MSRSVKPRTNIFGTRLMGGVVALVFLCGITLLGGTQQPRGTVSGTGFWQMGSSVPLVDVGAYPRDCQRSSEARWRFTGEGDDQPDEPFALPGQNSWPTPAALISPVPAAKTASRSYLSFHRPQAARAPPLA